MSECDHVFGWLIYEGEFTLGCLGCGLLPHDPPLTWDQLVAKQQVRGCA